MTNNSREYEILRSEILSKYNSIQASISTIYIVTFSILAFSLGTQNKEYFVCLIPLFVIVPLYIRSQNHNKGIAMLRAYLYVFHEGKDKDFMWERRHHALEEEYNNKSVLFLRKLRVPMPYYMLVIICSAASLVKFFENRNTKSMLIRILEEIMGYHINLQHCVYINFSSIIVCCFSALYIIYRYHNNFINIRNMYIRRWEQIRKNEGVTMNS